MRLLVLVLKSMTGLAVHFQWPGMDSAFAAALAGTNPAPGTLIGGPGWDTCVGEQHDTFVSCEVVEHGPMP